MRHYDAVIFDLDGTLLDTSEGIFRSVGHVIETLHLPKIDEEVQRTFIGPPMQKSFARVFGMPEDEAASAANMFRDIYKDRDLFLARPYEGIYETVEELGRAGIRTAVATYKRQDYAEKILIHFGFDRICPVICGSDFEGKLTKKDIIDNAMRSLEVSDRKRAVMVGDSDNDAVGAMEAGSAFVAAMYGFGFKETKDAAKYPNIGMADRPEDLLRFVL